MSYFLGIDGGGTKTKAVLIDAEGNEIARAASGPSNYHSVGQGTAEASLREVICQILAIAGLAVADVEAIGLGIAGVARSDDRQVMQAILSHVAPCPRTVITHDAEVALVGGVGRRYGAVLIAGTGAIAYGVNARGESRRADGWGYLLGDDGSAYWIGREGLRAVARAHDGRGATTNLEGLLLSHLNLADSSALIGCVYAAGFGVPQVARMAPLVRQAAQAGDAVAFEILREAGQQLGCTLRAAIHGLDMAQDTFEVAFSGGVLSAKGPVWDAVVAALAQIAPYAQAIEPRHDAAFGAALLARQTGETNDERPA